MARGLIVVLSALAFGLLGVSASSGGLAWVPFVLVALLVTLNNLGYAELADGTPNSGGAYSLVYRADGGEPAAFLTGWALLLSEIGLCAVLARAAAAYIADLMTPVVEAPVPLGLLASGVVVIAALGRFIPRARRRGSRTAVAYLLGFAALVALGIARANSANMRPMRLDVIATLPPLLAAFVGLELITSFQRAARRRVPGTPLAMIIAPSVAALLGAVVAIMVVGVAGGQAAADVPASLGLVGEAIRGRWGQAAILVLAIVAIMPALSLAISLVVRLLFSMSLDRFLPGWLGGADRRRRSAAPGNQQRL